MATLTFKNAPSLAKETLALAGAGAAAGMFAPLYAGLSLGQSAVAAAFFGTSVAAALTRKSPMMKLARAAVGVVGGAVTMVGFATLSSRLGFDGATWLAGGIGGLALGTLLANEDETVGDKSATVLSMLGGATLGAIGTAAADSIGTFAAAEQSPTVVATAITAGLFGLWVGAGAGIRRLERHQDPIEKRAEALLAVVADPMKTRVRDAMVAFRDVIAAIDGDPHLGLDVAGETRTQARALMEALLATGEGWHRLSDDLASPRFVGVEDRLADVTQRAAESTDSVTQAHLARAAQALRAQVTALESLRLGRQRSEAAVDAQLALLDRLRLAVAQHRASDREHFALELAAVGDQVARLTDDLDSLAAAIEEAEAFADRRLLADVERAGRKALAELTAEVEARAERTRIDAEQTVPEDETISA